MTTRTNDVKQLITEYIADIEESGSASRNTLQAYKRDLGKFAEYAFEHDINDICDVDSDTIADFKEYLNESGLSVSSSSRTLSALRSFFCRLLADGVVNANPAKEIHNDKPEKRDTNILSQKDIELLLAQPNLKDIKGIRDKAMLELLYATGIKVSELIALDVDDLNLQISFLKVGNDDKQRFIPLYKLAVKSLQNYVLVSRKMLVAGENENALFVNCNGERMTRQGVWKLIKYYAAKADIKADITPHTLRHSFAAHLLQNGADIHDIQEILGHSDISSTQRYAQFLKEKVSKSYIKFHPRA